MLVVYNMKKYCLGISIGGTKTAVSHACFDGEFKDVIKETFPTNPNNPFEVLENIYKCIEKINKPFSAISVICGGPLNVKKGTILKPPHLPGFDDFNIVKTLNDKYDVPVTLLNDADACALAEYKLGAGRGYKNVAFITFGTGLGSGLILNGELFTGNNGMAGEVGHVRLSENGPVGYGKVGSSEGFCSGGNIPVWGKTYIENKKTNLHNYEVLTTKDIAYEANNGDEVALEIFDIVATRLGETVSILIDLLNLDRVIIGGIYPRCENLLKEKMIETVKKESIKDNFEVCSIVPSFLRENIDEYSSLVGLLLGDDMKTFYERYPELEGQKENIETAINILEHCFKNNGKILVCGNGGSASDSAHIVGELMKSFVKCRPLDNELTNKLNELFDDETVAKKLQLGIPCIDLGANSALNLAMANDVDADLVFAQQIIGYSKNSPNDVVIGLSTSGNSKNVVNAIKVAKSLGLNTISLTGKRDSKLSEISTVTIRAPEEETYKIQEYHLPIYHYICIELEKRI